MIQPAPLEQGTMLSNRFEIRRMLGRGGFAIAYSAHDHTRQDDATIKELAPTGSTRSSEGVLQLNDANPHRLRDRFLDEARTIARLDIQGVLPVRATFVENGTAYYATDYVPGGQTLQHLLDDVGRLDADGALDIFFQLLETLDALHGKRILHRDIKPSNVLLSPNGQAFLIDFGAAREWLADMSQRQTILFTPGYAPLEQLAEKAARGPATDLYALCATLYHMLSGEIPIPAADRAAGEKLVPLLELRPEIEASVARAIEAGMRLQFSERPQSVEALRDLFSQPAIYEIRSLEAYDGALVRLREFHFERMECPSCGEPLDEPRPLRAGGCPVCRDGMIKRRPLSDRQCPVCRDGVLHRQDNTNPITACPICKLGRLRARRKGLLSKELSLICEECGARFESVGRDMLRRVSEALEANLSGGESGSLDHRAAPPPQFGSPSSVFATVDLRLTALPRNVVAGEGWPIDEWRGFSGRSIEIWRCDSCFAQFDSQPDGRRKIITPHKDIEFECLYPEEWARVAAGLDPGAGNAVCNACGADFFVDDRSITLLGASEDAFSFSEWYLGRRIELADLPWIAVGKQSPKPGLHCPACDLEFDRDGEYLRLVRSRNARLGPLVGEPFTMEDWHRLAQGLPTVNDEEAFREGIEPAIQVAYERGEIGFDAANTVIWSGPATDDEGRDGTLTITSSELTFGGMLRKERKPLDALLGAEAEGDRLLLRFRGIRDSSSFDIEPIELTVTLESGRYTSALSAVHLAARLSNS